MKFLADMGISPKTVAFLWRQGHEAIHLHEQSLDKLEDSDILEKARNEGRILLAHDLGFGELVAASGMSLPSVITFRLRSMNPERVNRYLAWIIANHQQDLAQGAILSVTEGRIRVRSLPFSKSGSA